MFLQGEYHNCTIVTALFNLSSFCYSQKKILTVPYIFAQLTWLASFSRLGVGALRLFQDTSFTPEINICRISGNFINFFCDGSFLEWYTIQTCWGSVFIWYKKHLANNNLPCIYFSDQLSQLFLFKMDPVHDYFCS